MDEEFIGFVQKVLQELYGEGNPQTCEWLRKNFEKLDEEVNLARQTRLIVEEWQNQQGHNRCWYYPDLFRRLAEIYGIKQAIPSNLPPEEEFKAGCEKYRREEYGEPR